MKIPDYLNLKIKHTNLSEPRSEFVGYDKFPEQNNNLLNKTVDIKYRNMNIVDREVREDRPEEFEQYDIYTSNCTVLRCDITEPFVMICKSVNDPNIILVTDSRCWEDKVVQYPIQLDEFIGLKVLDAYDMINVIDLTKTIESTIIRCDNGEPCFTVLEETLSNNSKRYVLGDECKTLYKLQE